MTPSRLVVLLGLVAALGACGPKEINYQLKIITKSCSTDADPFAGVQYLRLRVSGDGITTPLESTSVVDAAMHQLSVPQIPVGKNRRIEVRGYDSDPRASGKVLSMGSTVPFDVPSTVPLPGDASLTQTLFLRKVGALTPVSSADAPDQCQSLTQPRAGHTATVLKDGRVFIAGGYKFADNSAQQVALSATEIFDPRLGKFATAHDISFGSGSATQLVPKAFHTSSLLPSGQILLWGGETYPQISVAVPSPQLIIYDPDRDATGPLPMRQSPPFVARTRHSAVMDANQKLLIIGGRTRDQNQNLVPVTDVEWFDPETNAYSVIPGVSQPRDGAAAIAVQQGSFIAVSGGSDGMKLLDDVVYFSWSGSGFDLKTVINPPKLTTAVRNAAPAILQTGDDFILAGGYSDPFKVAPMSTSQVVATSTGAVTPGAIVESRGEACAVTLKTGDVFVAGGQSVDSGNMPESVASTVTVHVDPQGGTEPLGGPSLATPRHNHTCTLLNDGSVLITGGVNVQNGIYTVLQDAWIYQPPPVD